MSGPFYLERTKRTKKKKCHKRGCMCVPYGFAQAVYFFLPTCRLTSGVPFWDAPTPPRDPPWHKIGHDFFTIFAYLSAHLWAAILGRLPRHPQVSTLG